MPGEVLCRSSSKRKRDDQAVQSRTENKRQYQEPDDALADSRRILLKLFNAIETTLTASLTRSSSFHSIQQAVRHTARCDFEWTHLAQIVGVWKDAYAFESAMTLHNNKRVPSLILSRPDPVSSRKRVGTVDPPDRRKEFAARLQDWQGETGELPALKTTTLMPLDTAKIESIRSSSSSSSSTSPIQASPISDLDGRSRQSALLERVRQKKAVSLLAAPTRENAVLTSLLPAATSSLRTLLTSSRKAKVFGLRELADNIATSLTRSRLSSAEAESLVRLVAAAHPAWCKLGQVGEVVVVRFFGSAPSTN